MTALLDAVDALTLPTTARVDQGAGPPTVIKHAPLLDQLEAAVAGGIGSHAGASAYRERMPLNADAMRLVDEVSGEVMRWHLRLSSAVRFGSLAGRVRAWYVLHVGTVTSEHTDKAFAGVLEGWQREVEALFDPPTRLEVTAPCPMCAARFSTDERTGDRVTAVTVEYREVGVLTLDEAVGSCRACKVVWKGRSALRELRWLIEVAEAQTEEAA